MSKFKVGDKVKVLKKTTGDSLEKFYSIVGYKDFYFIIRNQDKCGEYQVGTDEGDKYFKESDLELYNKFNNKLMDIKEKFVALFTKEPEKSYIKAGLMDNDKIVTDDGMKIFNSYLMTKTELGKEFKEKVVDVMLEEEKGDK